MMDLEVSSFPPTIVEASFPPSPSHLLAECAVCHQNIPKGRVHYGGVSCYSCRAFFRRNTQRDELPTCKSGGGCTITHQDRKQCSACRYAKCISIGMRRELVLDANGKQERFKKYLRKKNDERMKAEEQGSDDKDTKPMPPLAPIPGMNFPMSVLLQRARSNYQLPYFPQDSSFPKPELFPGFRFPLSSAAPTMAAASLSPAAPVDLRRATSPAKTNLYSNPADFPRSSSLSPSARISPSLLPVPSPSLSPRHLPSTILLSPPLPSPPHPPHHPQSSSFTPSLALLQRSSVISKGEYFDEEKSREVRSSSSEVEDGASSSKRCYWPLPQILENSLPLQVEIKEEVVSEPEDVATEEDSLLQKYCHKKFQKAKTFSSDLRLPLEAAGPDNRKRRSVIVAAPSSRAKVPCGHLRTARMARIETGEKEWLGERSAEEEESYSPVDLSCSSAASSPRGESGLA